MAVLITIGIKAIAFLLALSAHELAHGYVSAKLGDPTPRWAGRLTLNPLAHLDPLGTLVFLLTSLLNSFSGGGGFVIGWAKPVPVDPRYYRNPRQGLTLVGLAGPGANVLLAVAFGLPLRLGLVAGRGLAGVLLLTFLEWMVFTNAGLAAFNLLPVPPLDGSKILAGILPRRRAALIWQLERYGPFLLMLLLLTGWVYPVLGPLFQFFVRLALGGSVG
ncbi:MAG: site-2 protease family protein [Chitinophagales bacterium]